jgi:hypothetical protein
MAWYINRPLISELSFLHSFSELTYAQIRFTVNVQILTELDPLTGGFVVRGLVEFCHIFSATLNKVLQLYGYVHPAYIDERENQDTMYLERDHRPSAIKIFWHTLVGPSTSLEPAPTGGERLCNFTTRPRAPPR